MSGFFGTAFGAWLIGFTFTQAIEVPLYLRVTHGRWSTSFLASTLTHPIVWFVFPRVCPLAWGYWGMVAAAEVFAVAGETVWLRLNGVGASLFSGLNNTTAAYDSRVRSMVAMLLTLPRFQEQ